ncbi:serine/threonine-protein kinase [Kutzneria sp. CA-103260]|uniref:serine/threonine-protein kinase n=1 Tax=Kutzneria sp. CA-103260 TaxID=2802641 RepID=UPI001BED8B71|nr:serine/threonine-protein kinase [Kutzneria sp. CA-103260]QUQ67703.1 Serine/threonine-protein kinase PknD [Kutzneria sp. CA-103260]
MDGVGALVIGLLSGLHSAFGWQVCNGDWVLTTVITGGFFALAPIAAAMVVALIRKVTGNNYNPVMVMLFTGIGVVGNLLLPFSAFSGAAYALRDAPQQLVGAASLTYKFCYVLAPQNRLLGDTPLGAEAISGGVIGPERWLSIAALVVVPVFVLFWITKQAKNAFRGGARWPARLFYAPYIILVFSTLSLPVGVVGLLWLGFLPVSAVGVLAVKMLGTPSDAVLHPNPKHASAADEPGAKALGEHRPAPPSLPPAKPQTQAAMPRQNPPTKMYTQAQPQPQPQPQRPPVQPRPQTQFQPQPRPLPPSTRVQPPPSAAAGGLAMTPGPLPWATTPAPDPDKTVYNPLDAPTKFDSTGDSFGGRFRRIRQLGAGGFGKVWLAMDGNLNRQVAIKIAHTSDADTQERMYREARALAAVRHENCVHVYDILEEQDGIAIVMEYVEGMSLAQTMQRNGLLDDVAAARLWSTLAGALGAAHEKSVLHRDLKPSNVIIDPEGLPHLIDFGLARRRGDSTLTATGMMMGTPDYLAPEVARGETASPASDAWQLAATVSYALTGHPPRGTRENPMAALLAGANAEPNTNLPERSVHRRLLMASLDKDPGRRPTLGRVQQQLDGWLANSGVAQKGPVTTVTRRI